jgi:hypothetical protein
MNAGFHGSIRLGGRLRKKARSVAAVARSGKKKSDSSVDRFGFRQSSYGYPQNLWISLWMTEARRIGQRYKSMTRSKWSKFHHVITA